LQLWEAKPLSSGQTPPCRPIATIGVIGLPRATRRGAHRTTEILTIVEDYAALNPPIIEARLATIHRNERSQPLHLLVALLEKIAHGQPLQIGGLNHEAIAASSRSIGSEHSCIAHSAREPSCQITSSTCVAP
jgi:hypothetical protein